MGIMNCWFMHPGVAARDRGPRRHRRDHRHRRARPARDRHQGQHAPHLGAGDGAELRPRHRARAQPSRPRLQGRPDPRLLRRRAPPLQGPVGRRADADLDARLRGPGARGRVDRALPGRPRRARRRRTRERRSSASTARPRCMGFLLHFDNRLGVGDHGPYHLADGGFVLARDIIVDEPAFPWSDGGGLPYAFTVAMFFAPGLRARGRDDGHLDRLHDARRTTSRSCRASPSTGATRWDTPMDEIRTVGLDDMAELRTLLEERSAALYQRIAAMSKRERIESGAMVYTAGFALPVRARRRHVRRTGCRARLPRDAPGGVGVLRDDHQRRRDGDDPAAVPDRLVGQPGARARCRDELSGDDAELPVLHALKVRGFAGADAVAESSGLDEATVAGDARQAVTERGHAKRREGRITGYSLTPAGSARHVLLLRDSVPRATVSKLAAVYESFLAPNREFKQLTSDWQQGSGGGNAGAVGGRARRGRWRDRARRRRAAAVRHLPGPRSTARWRRSAAATTTRWPSRCQAATTTSGWSCTRTCSRRSAASGPMPTSS